MEYYDALCEMALIYLVGASAVNYYYARKLKNTDLEAQENEAKAHAFMSKQAELWERGNKHGNS